MKRHLIIQLLWLFTLILILNSSFIQAQDYQSNWTVVPLETENDLNSVIWSNNNGWIVGNGGTIFYSSNGGVDWQNQSFDNSIDYNGVSIQQSTDINQTSYSGTFVGSNGAIYSLSMDQHGNYAYNQQQMGTYGNLNDVFYAYSPHINQSYGYIAGHNSVILNSTDGGQNWNPQSTPYQHDHFYGIHFTDTDYGWIVGSTGIIYKTINGGSEWKYVEGPHTNPDYYGVYFDDPLYGWICGSNGTIMYTENSGNTWTQKNSGTSETLYDIIFLDEYEGWIVGSSGTTIHTTNKGDLWNAIDIGTTYDLNRISNDTQGNLWIVGNHGTLVTNKPPESTFSTSRSTLNFAGITGTNNPDPQTVYINVKNNEKNGWIIVSDQDWLSVIPNKGTGSGYFSVFIDQSTLSEGEYTGTITIDVPDATPKQTEIDVSLNMKNDGNTSGPFGSFETPTDGSTVMSSVPITGWALDDMGIESVKIYRNSEQGVIYIGDASLIEGARPDVETAYPDYPNNHKAGWGYMLLTNFLPNGGNGTFILYAKANDVEGNNYLLGSKTIHCDNANAIKPFGAIDTPTQGGTASGSGFRNQGWVLTPQPKEIPTNGSTINVYVDGVKIGHPIYNIYKHDIATLFPGYANSNGAAGYLYLDTTEYENGVHSIYWTAQDNTGASDGIGSRYFIIRNSNDPAPKIKSSYINYGSSSKGSYKNVPDHYEINSNHPYTQAFQVYNSGDGILNWEVTADQPWISLNPVSGTEDGWVYVTVDPVGLPEGTHNGKITVSEAENANPPEFIKIGLEVYQETEAPIGEFNYPDEYRIVDGSINLTGWALDDIGVESVKIYQQNGIEKIYLGDADFSEGSRPDIATFYAYFPNSTRAGWSYAFSTNTLEDGDYKFVAEATDFEGNTTTLEGNTFTIDNENAVLPFGMLDTPAEGDIISGENYEILGWALTPKPNIISTDSSTISVILDGISIGQVTYNLPREDIRVQFPDYLNSEGPGGLFILNTTEFNDGVHTICWSATDSAGNTNERLGIRHFTIQNHSEVSDVNSNKILPIRTDLLPAYPNPFNPVTNISYYLSKAGIINISVFNILGRKVITLIEHENKPAGSYKIRWNGKNQYGQLIANGVYIIVMNTERFKKSQKLIMLK
jgi:photosystem II stability/assembly factor-like uncharacterized protein